MSDKIEIKLQELGGIEPFGRLIDPEIKFTPMSDLEIQEIELCVNSRIPNEYRSHMLKYGASRLIEPIVIKTLSQLPKNITSNTYVSMNSFYGSKNGKGSSLLKNIRIHRGRMPDSIIPIADDGNNLICLGISGNEYGKIYYWDRANEPYDEEEYFEVYEKPRPPEHMFSNVHLIADSFEDLIMRMEISENEQLRVNISFGTYTIQLLDEAARDHVAPAINEILANAKPGGGKGLGNIKPPKGGALPLVPGGGNGKLNIIPPAPGNIKNKADDLYRGNKKGDDQDEGTTAEKAARETERKKLEEEKKDFEGKVKGNNVKLPGVKTQKIKFKKRDPEETEEKEKGSGLFCDVAFV